MCDECSQAPILLWCNYPSKDSRHSAKGNWENRIIFFEGISALTQLFVSDAYEEYLINIQQMHYIEMAVSEENLTL